MENLTSTRRRSADQVVGNAGDPPGNQLRHFPAGDRRAAGEEARGRGVRAGVDGRDNACSADSFSERKAAAEVKDFFTGFPGGLGISDYPCTHRGAALSKRACSGREEVSLHAGDRAARIIYGPLARNVTVHETRVMLLLP